MEGRHRIGIEQIVSSGKIGRTKITLLILTITSSARQSSYDFCLNLMQEHVHQDAEMEGSVLEIMFVCVHKVTEALDARRVRVR